MEPDLTVLASLRKAVEAMPDDVPLRVHLAALLLRAGQRDEAIRHVGAVLQRDPGNAEALALLQQPSGPAAGPDEGPGAPAGQKDGPGAQAGQNAAGPERAGQRPAAGLSGPGGPGGPPRRGVRLVQGRVRAARRPAADVRRR